MRPHAPRGSVCACTLALATLIGPVWSSWPAWRPWLAGQQPAAELGAAREDAWRANNIGVARLEQYDFAGAASAFRQALKVDPALAVARLNLGIALFYGGQPDEARREIEAARADLPERPQPDYVLGLIARANDRTPEAIDAFARVRRTDSSDVGAAVNLGQLYLQERRFDEAIGLFRAAVEAEPYNATAAYGLATALVRSGASADGRAAMERFQRLRESGYATTFSQNYLEQGRYAEAIASTGAEPDLVSAAIPDVTFTDATVSAFGSAAPKGAPEAPAQTDQASSVALFDLDGDGDLDLMDAAGGLRVFHNEGGRFTDRTALAFPSGPPRATAALPGDYDNDSRTDVLVLGPSSLTLYRGDPSGAFVDTTAAAGLGSSSGVAHRAAWLDADHDGDLDLFVAIAATGATPAATRLLRNNGDGRFTDITTAAGIAVQREVAAVVPTDYDNRRDIDLLLVTDGAPILFRNLRDGTFRDAAADAGLHLDRAAPASPGRDGMAAIGDVNKDGYVDLFFARRGGPGVIAESDGRGRFSMAAAPPEASDALAAQFIDYDDDGLLDLVALTTRGPRVLRNVGRRWMDVTARAIPSALSVPFAESASLASGDVDGDGDVDAVVRSAGRLAVWRNEGGRGARSVRVRLTARVSNRTAVGAKIEMRAGSLRGRHETYAAVPAPAPADVRFGLGARAGADVVRVLWPSGILQAETASPPAETLTGTLSIEELDRKPSSCPYLFTWNGERFEFLTDFLGGGEMGYWLAPGVRNRPDPDEYVRIPADRLRPREGRLEVRVTNELEEAVFLDRLELIAVDHAQNEAVYPNEGIRSGAEPFRLFSTRRPRVPVAAVDEHGHDVLDRVARVDRRYPDDFALESIRGYAAEHSLTITLPDRALGPRVLLLTGWTDYAFSGDNVAAHQKGLRMVPPYLQVADRHGRWRTVIDNIGFPAGRPQTVPVELPAHLADGARLRIVTTMRVYWDRVLVAELANAGDGRPRLTRLDPLAADLRWRGFSAAQSLDGREPFDYAYSEVSAFSPWKLLPGRYTREGDVRELLATVDDRFVVSRPGDEIAVAFDATALPPLAPGLARTYLMYSDGFSKEMNLNSSSPDQLAPLPFHRMTAYPYGLGESYPQTDAHRDYLERYNTRLVPRSIPPIELSGRRP